MELAMEISANENITEPLPMPITWQDFSPWGLKPGQSTYERYELLVQARLRGLPQPCPAPIDCHLSSGVLANKTEESPPILSSQIRQMIHEAIEQSQNASGIEPRFASSGLLAGRDPGQLLEELTDTDREPESYREWKAAIQAFVSRVRAPVHTYARPNRRFPGKVGLVPGRIWSPGQVEKPTIIVAIDTSASMLREELSEIARQLLALNSLVKITVAECDTMIQRVYPFEGRLLDVSGRGGTDFCPIFELQFLREHRPDGVIYFTDGYGPYPSPPDVKTLWILSKINDRFDCPWGEKAYLSSFPGA